MASSDNNSNMYTELWLQFARLDAVVAHTDLLRAVDADKVQGSQQALSGVPRLDTDRMCGL